VFKGHAVKVQGASFRTMRPRSAVTHGSLRLLSAARWARSPIAIIQGSRPVDPLMATPIDLSKADLFGANLTGASLRGGIARNAVFYTAVAQGTVFEGAHLEGADFRQADLKDAQFAGAWLNGARFDGAQDLPENVAGLLDQAGRVREGEGMPVPSA
jgi:Pentapeptide repeats (8 copies)